MNENPRFAVQHSFEHEHDKIIQFEKNTAARISLSGLQDFEEYLMVKDGTKKLNEVLKVTSPQALRAKYRGIQSHKLLFFLDQFYSLEPFPHLRKDTLPPFSHTLWQKPEDRRVQRQIFWDSIANVQGSPGIERLVMRTRKAFDDWSMHQNFYVDLPPASQQNFHESRIFKPGRREKEWYSPQLAGHTELLLENLAEIMEHTHTHDSASHFVGSDYLSEMPASLYISHDSTSGEEKKREKILMWIQPDRVNLIGNQVVVYDHKFEKNLPNKADLTPFTRLQILLLALAGKVLATKYLKDARSVQHVEDLKPDFVHMSDIPYLIQGVRVIYQSPLEMENGQPYQEEMTLTDEEIAGSFYDLQYVMKYLADPYQRNEMYDFLKHKKALHQGEIPTTIMRQTEAYQPLLGL